MNIVSINDRNFEYAETGTGDELILLNGIGGCVFDWKPEFIKALSKDHRLILPNIRGISRSDDHPSDYYIEDMAEDIKGLIDELGISRCHVAGYSIGGMMAQELALKYPEVVNKLVLIATNCGKDSQVEKGINAMAGVSGTLEEIIRANAKILLTEKWTQDNPDFMSWFPLHETLPDPAVFKKHSMAIINWRGTSDRLVSLKNETFILMGDGDIVTPVKDAALLEKLIPDSRKCIIENAGHGMLYQHPIDIANKIINFLSAKTRV